MADKMVKVRVLQPFRPDQRAGDEVPCELGKAIVYRTQGFVDIVDRIGPELPHVARVFLNSLDDGQDMLETAETVLRLSAAGAPEIAAALKRFTLAASKLHRRHREGGTRHLIDLYVNLVKEIINETLRPSAEIH